jgi:4-hydroxy-tetrahydrodipicolinate synthase
MAKRHEAKEWAREKIRGLFTSPTIPFTPDLRLDEAGIRHNVDRMVAAKAAGIGFGFTEPWVLSLEERKRGMEVALDAVRGRAIGYLHAADHSVAETLNLCQYAKHLGAEAVMLWAPYEWAKSQDMVADFYEYVASKLDLAIIAYNTYHSGIAMTPETVARIAKIPNVCALKDGVNDVEHTVACMRLCGDQIVISDPLENHLLEMTVQHGQQVLLGTTGVYLLQSPERQPIHEYQQLALAGQVAEATRLRDELQPLRDVWEGIYEVLWDKSKAVHPLPTIKYWTDLMGMAGGPMRPPMRGIGEADKAAFKARLDASGWRELLFPSQVRLAA